MPSTAKFPKRYRTRAEWMISAVFHLKNLSSAQKKSKSYPFSLPPPPPPRFTIIVWIHQRQKVRSFCPAPETISAPFLCIQFQSGRDPYGRNSSLLGDCKPEAPSSSSATSDRSRRSETKQRKKEEKKEALSRKHHGQLALALRFQLV